MTRPVYITAARRSIVAPRGGALAHLELHQIAAPIVRACLADADISPDVVDEIIVSNALGAGGNPARVIALATGLPEHVAGVSIDRQCVGGLDALLLGQAMIASGQANIVVAGGVESYSRRPYRAHILPDGMLEPYDQPMFAPTSEQDPDMAEAADRMATQLGISRQSQDAYARASHARAMASRTVLQTEIAPIPDVAQMHDSFSRALSAKLCARAPVITGNITHANAAVAADGAAFCVLSASPGVQSVQMLGGATVGANPALPALAPAVAVKTAMARLGLSIDQIDRAEVMEAYAAQAIATVRETGLRTKHVNQHGGALARGHPVGASGAILAVRLFHDLCGSGQTGLATIAAAGGLGTAVVLRGCA